MPKAKEGRLKVVPWFINAAMYYILPIDKVNDFDKEAAKVFDYNSYHQAFIKKWAPYQKTEEEIDNLRIIIEE